MGENPLTVKYLHVLKDFWPLSTSLRRSTSASKVSGNSYLENNETKSVGASNNVLLKTIQFVDAKVVAVAMDYLFAFFLMHARKRFNLNFNFISHFSLVNYLLLF